RTYARREIENALARSAFLLSLLAAPPACDFHARQLASRTHGNRKYRRRYQLSAWRAFRQNLGDQAASTNPGTSARAASICSGFVPPAWAKSARPPPRPPQSSATGRISSPALNRPARSLVTPATSTTLSPSTAPSTTTPEPSLSLSWSAVSR